jgi:hypothetical protein
MRYLALILGLVSADAHACEPLTAGAPQIILRGSVPSRHIGPVAVFGYAIYCNTSTVPGREIRFSRINTKGYDLKLLPGNCGILGGNVIDIDMIAPIGEEVIVKYCIMQWAYKH